MRAPRPCSAQRPFVSRGGSLKDSALGFGIEVEALDRVWQANYICPG
jgi:hypothetical protein